jgi:hypothetical protein
MWGGSAVSPLPDVRPNLSLSAKRGGLRWASARLPEGITKWPFQSGLGPAGHAKEPPHGPVTGGRTWEDHAPRLRQPRRAERVPQRRKPSHT